MVSAEHGTGSAELLDAILDAVPTSAEEAAEQAEAAIEKDVEPIEENRRMPLKATTRFARHGRKRA